MSKQYRETWLLGLALAAGSPAGWTDEAARRFEFHEPGVVAYRVESGGSGATLATTEWLRAQAENGSTNAVWFGSRVVLRVDPKTALPPLLESRPLRLDRVVASNLFLLQGPDALTAAVEAERLGRQPGVQVSHPVRRRPLKLHGVYGPKPNDPLFPRQWHLENRDPNTAAPRGFDLNVRSAWPASRGAGVVVAVGDDGIELNHPDLATNLVTQLHHNFVTGSANGGPTSGSQVHATAVAGLIAARSGNARGMAGVAPLAQLASWVIFDRDGYLAASEEQMLDMFQYRSNAVSVQNHSWGNADVYQIELGALEDQGIDNAVQRGREGRGVVLVRSAGNLRDTGNDVNDDGYAQDPRTIAVAAVRNSGRVATYSTPGAPILVGAFSGDAAVTLADGSSTNYPNLATTDRQGSLGYNSGAKDADYAYDANGFSGTSGSAPLVSGLCALLLAANPTLTYRDVQQILIHAARQLDPADPDVRINGAGFAVSHNVGFGVPDAGLAVALAREWKNRPARTSVSVPNRRSADIPDDGLRLVVTGNQVPPELASIPATPSVGLHPDDPTDALPMVDAGQALSPIADDLSGKAALIQRGINRFAQKIQFAAAAGARFVVVYDNVDGAERVQMGGGELEFQPIPAVFIGQNSGAALQEYLATAPEARVQLQLQATARFSFNVSPTLLCEQVQLNARLSHPRRSDVRITLVSPAGTRSVLHHANQDPSALGAWVFYSTHHFYEASAGVWQVEVSDEAPGSTGRVISMDLTVYGVPIEDTDHDGLEDAWETRHFGTLAFGPSDDPDGDGFDNAREQILDWNPLAADRPLRLDLSRWDARLARLSWPASTDHTYELVRQSSVTGEKQVLGQTPGRFPELEWFVPYTEVQSQFFEVRPVSRSK